MALNYKMDIYCKNIEANMALVDKNGDSNVDKEVE